MSRGSAWFSDNDKQMLKEQLIKQCESNWIQGGYKGTSITTLTKQAGISAGAFYSLFDSKEDLFFQTLQIIQERLQHKVLTMIKKEPHKKGFYLAVKYLYKEYINAPFLYDVSSPDMNLFIKKIPLSLWEEYRLNNIAFLSSALQLVDEKITVTVEEAHAILSTLMYTITATNLTSVDSAYVFDFMLEGVLEKLFTK